MNNPRFQAHAAHARPSSESSDEDLAIGPLPSQVLHATSDEVHTWLERLDDVIFSAMSGDPDALYEARLLWPTVVSELGWPLVEESREQYLRYAIEITRRADQQKIRSPEQAVVALEIISLLMKE